MGVIDRLHHLKHNLSGASLLTLCVFLYLMASVHEKYRWRTTVLIAAFPHQTPWRHNPRLHILPRLVHHYQMDNASTDPKRAPPPSYLVILPQCLATWPRVDPWCHWRLTLPRGDTKSGVNLKWQWPYSSRRSKESATFSMNQWDHLWRLWSLPNYFNCVCRNSSMLALGVNFRHPNSKNGHSSFVWGLANIVSHREMSSSRWRCQLFQRVLVTDILVFITSLRFSLDRHWRPLR